MRVGRSCDADQVITQLEQVVVDPRRPLLPALRRRAGVHRRGALGLVPLLWNRFGVHRARLTLAEPLRGESFNARVRDELLNMTEFYTLERPRCWWPASRPTTTGTDRTHRSGTWLAPCSPRVEDGSSTPPTHREWTGSGVRPSSLDRRQG